MHSALEEEIRGRLSGLTLRIRQYDVGVILAVALCFTPLPPTMLVGLILSIFHLTLARSKISKPESSFLYAGVLATIGYIAAWTIALYWLARAGELHAMLASAAAWASWLFQNFEPTFLHHSLPPPPLVQHA